MNNNQIQPEVKVAIIKKLATKTVSNIYSTPPTVTPVKENTVINNRSYWITS